jgi:hypothetical protein
MIGANPLRAQDVTFSLPDSTGSLGINPNGGGLMGFAWGDYDQDGDLDLLLGGAIDNLFRNDVPTGGGFVRVSANTSGEPGTVLFDSAGAPSNSMQWADFNGDGNLDLLVGNTPNFRIFLYDGSRFTIVDPVATGLIVTSTNTWGVTVGDFDRDGDVDIANAGGTQTGDGAGPPHILRNDNGIFTDVGAELVPVPLALECWNPQWVDIDKDGYLDLWLPTIRRNITPAPRCELLFSDTAGELSPADPSTSGLADALSAIVSVWGDYNNDGFMDLWLYPFSGDGSAPIRLYRNNGDRTFTDVAPAAGMDSLVTTSTTRGASWGDYNNDGWLDLFVQRRNINHHELWHNNGDGTFEDVGLQAGLVTPNGDHRTAQFVDYDSDGWLDIFFSGNGGAQEWIFHNDGGNDNHWIGFRPRGTVGSNTAGIGARVTVVTGTQRQYRYVDGGGTGGNFWPHFGLGLVATVDSVIVDWPTGTHDFSTNVPADKYYTLQEGTGVIVSVKGKPGDGTIPTGYALSQNYPNPFNPVTKIQFDLPKSSAVRLVLVNVAGELVREIANGKFTAGRHEVTVDARNLASGVYFYRIEAGDFVAVKKLALVK